MFSHIMVGTNDLDKAKKFYDSVLGALGVPAAFLDKERNRMFYRTREGIFAVTKPIDGKSATSANGATIGFAAKSPAEVEAWHKAGTANGGTSIEDPPGVREGAAGKMFLAYLRDPDGNKICALHRMQ